MKITYKGAAQSLLILAASITALAQREVNPGRTPDQSRQTASTPRQDDQIQTLQARLQVCEGQLRAKSELVEKTRQEAIAAAALGDGAGIYIDAYRQQVVEAKKLQAELMPQIDQLREQIASLNKHALPAAVSLGRKPVPASKSKATPKTKVEKPEQAQVTALTR